MDAPPTVTESCRCLCAFSCRFTHDDDDDDRSDDIDDDDDDDDDEVMGCMVLQSESTFLSPLATQLNFPFLSPWTTNSILL
jgi:hypothetical protein